MMVWYENIWLRYVRERLKETGFYKSLKLMDTFKVDFTDDVKAAMLIGHIIVVKVPAEYTSKVQLLGVCINC